MLFTEYISGCTVLSSVDYVGAFSNALSNAFGQLTEPVEAAMDAVLCDLQATIDYNVVEIT